MLLQLLRKALDNSNQVELPKGTDWASVLELASEQGVQGICLEAIEQLPAGTIPQPTLLQWIGLSELQRQQYEQTWRVACKLDKLWAAEGIQATVLKGRSIWNTRCIRRWSARWTMSMWSAIGISHR